MEASDKEFFFFVISALGTLAWSVITWTIVRIIKRADAHSKRMDEGMHRLTKVESAIPAMDEATTLRQKSLEKDLGRIEEMLIESKHDHKELKAQIDKYILSKAAERNEILEKILDKISK